VAESGESSVKVVGMCHHVHPVVSVDGVEFSESVLEELILTATRLESLAGDEVSLSIWNRGNHLNIRVGNAIRPKIVYHGSSGAPLDVSREVCETVRIMGQFYYPPPCVAVTLTTKED